MWETCPKCSGTGKTEMNPVLPSGIFSSECPVCKGKMIISKLTGLPPTHKGRKEASNIPDGYSLRNGFPKVAEPISNPVPSNIKEKVSKGFLSYEKIKSNQNITG